MCDVSWPLQAVTPRHQQPWPSSVAAWDSGDTALATAARKVARPGPGLRSAFTSPSYSGWTSRCSPACTANAGRSLYGTGWTYSYIHWDFFSALKV